MAGSDASPSPATSALQAGTAVAVTGGTGFIGRRLVARLVDENVSVRCLVRRPARSLPAAVEARVVDLSDPDEVRSALAGIDVVFHCAFDWNDDLWNVGAMRSLIAGCRQNGCRRLVHVSSFVVYEIPDHGELTEEAPPTRASSGYAHLKLELERELLRAVERNEVSAAIIQPTIVYGPYSKPWTIDPADMLRHGTVVLPDRGEGTCNAVYVDDVVSAMLLAATNLAAVGRRFLVSGPPVTWGEFYRGIAKAAGAKGPEFRPSAVIRREGEPRRKLLALVVDPERLVRRAAYVGPVRRLVEAAAAKLPQPWSGRIRDRLYGPDTRRRGQVHLPDHGRLHFLQGTASVGSAKARRHLGYVPQFDFERGLVPTAAYLRGTDAISP